MRKRVNRSRWRHDERLGRSNHTPTTDGRLNSPPTTILIHECHRTLSVGVMCVSDHLRWWRHYRLEPNDKWGGKIKKEIFSKIDRDGTSGEHREKEGEILLPGPMLRGLSSVTPARLPFESSHQLLEETSISAAGTRQSGRFFFRLTWPPLTFWLIQIYLDDDCNKVDSVGGRKFHNSIHFTN